MAVVEYHTLDELEHISPVDWTIKVKLSRKWNDPNNNYGRHCGVNMILNDERHNRIHAWILSSYRSLFDEILVEDHRHMIFTRSTRVTHLPGNHWIIPQHIFHFTQLDCMNQLCNEDSYCIDVVGILDSRQGLEFTTNRRNEEAIYLDFVITDTINKVNVCFKNDLALSCNIAFNNAALQPLQPIIILIASCTFYYNRHTGRTLLSNARAIMFYINPNNEVVQSLRNSFWAVHGV